MNKATVSIVVILLLALGLGDMVQPVQTAFAQGSSGKTFGELSEVEIESILYMREEEKLARDVYIVLYDVYGAQVFLNISASEQTHFDQMGVLLDRYGLDDPALEPGVFTDHHLQELYDELIMMGLGSLKDAYIVGAIIEEVDILDFLHYLGDEQVDNKDIRQVYTNLMEASENHLRAFVGNLLSIDVVYEPQYLSQAQYDAIIAGETGGVGNCNGH